MTSPLRLPLAYIRKSPESAARVLASMSPQAAAGFIEGIPTAYAVKLVVNLPPVQAAKLFQAVDGKVAAAIFRDLDLSKASAIVRQMNRATRTRFLAGLSRRVRTALDRSLSFAPGTVGAHMTTAIPTLTQTNSAAAVLETIKQSDRDQIDLVFVLNDSGNFVGVVSSTAALRQPGTATLSSISDTSCPQVSAYLKLEAIADASLWHDYAYLPVINRRREVIGAISRKTLSSNRFANEAMARINGQSIPAAMFSALAVASAGLFDLVSDSVTQTNQQGDNDGD